MLSKKKAFRIARIVEEMKELTFENKLKQVREKTRLLKKVASEELKIREDGLLYSVLVSFEENRRKKISLVKRGIKYSNECGDKVLRVFLKKELKSMQI